MGQPVVFFEIGCRESAPTAEFYSTVFGWQIAHSGMAAQIDTGSHDGIHGHIVALGHEPHNYTLVYVQVDDVDAYMERAKSLGGDVLVPRVDLPVGSFAWIADPEGNRIGLWKPK